MTFFTSKDFVENFLKFTVITMKAAMGIIYERKQTVIHSI